MRPESALSNDLLISINKINEKACILLIFPLEKKRGRVHDMFKRRWRAVPCASLSSPSLEESDSEDTRSFALSLSPSPSSSKPCNDMNEDKLVAWRKRSLRCKF